MSSIKIRVEMFRAGHLPLGSPTRELVDDLWQKYERVVRELRKISVPANEVGSSCLRCGARWSEGRTEHHAHGCVLEGTEPGTESGAEPGTESGAEPWPPQPRADRREAVS